MNKLAQMWSNLNDCLADIQNEAPFLHDLNNKFGEVFELKELQEFKIAPDYLTAEDFRVMSGIMRRAFIEGYLIAQMELEKEKIKKEYNNYKKVKDSTYEKNNSVDSVSNLTLTANRS